MKALLVRIKDEQAASEDWATPPPPGPSSTPGHAEEPQAASEGSERPGSAAGSANEAGALAGGNAAAEAPPAHGALPPRGEGENAEEAEAAEDEEDDREEEAGDGGGGEFEGLRERPGDAGSEKAEERRDEDEE